MLDGRCPNSKGRWWRSVACPRTMGMMTPRLPSPPTAGAEGAAGGGAGGRVGVSVSPLAAQASPTPAEARGQAAGTGGQAAGTAWNESHVRVVTVYDSPRVRLLYNFVSENEASELISIAQKHFVRSGTARAVRTVPRSIRHPVPCTLYPVPYACRPPTLPSPPAPLAHPPPACAHCCSNASSRPPLSRPSRRPCTLYPIPCTPLSRPSR